MNDHDLLSALKARVEHVRAESGFDPGQGVKMLYSDTASLSARYWTVGLNPGGGHYEDDQWQREDGAHDYRDGYLRPGVAKVRRGGLALRKQLSAMVAWLKIDWTETLSLNLVPFRSKSWANMPPRWRERALSFASDQFWPLLLEHRRPRLIVCFGHEAAEILRALLKHGEPREYSVGWGVVTADVTAANGGCILRVPHLSTFRIFDRKDGRGAAELAVLRNDPELCQALAG
jgi:hypothetical protein